MKYVIRAVKSRKPYVDEIMKQLPFATVYYDEFGNAMKSFLYTLEYIVGDDACVLMEDDIILTANFPEKIEKVISENRNTLINFFSLSKSKLQPHIKRGREFCMSQCVYLPEGFAKTILQKYDEWKEYDNGKNPTAYDYLIGYAWGSNRDYLVWQPSLVQHIECKSIIDPRRSSRRQSVTFKKE